MKTSKKYHKINNNIRSEIFKHAKKTYNSDPNISWGNCLKKSWQIAKSKPLFEKVFTEHYKYIQSNVSYRVNFNTIIISEITQDTFIKANRYYDSFNPFKSNIKTWLLTIAKSCIVDYYRAKTTRNQNNQNIESFVDEKGNEFFQIESDLTSDNSENELLQSAIDKALNNLSPKYKNVFTLFELEGKNYTEIANILDISEGTARTILSRAKAMLKESLKDFAHLA